jgi:small subunit ribosomal protein S15
MARLHTRKKGKSASHKPAVKSAGWVRQSKEEVVALIERLAREGKTEAQIGLALRDEHGVPSVKMLTGKKVSKILEEKKAAPKYPSALIDLIRKAVSLRKHMESNPRDKQNRKKLNDVESKIKRLVRYYRGKKLPKNWKYVPEEAALLVK